MVTLAIRHSFGHKVSTQFLVLAVASTPWQDHPAEPRRDRAVGYVGLTRIRPDERDVVVSIPALMSVIHRFLSAPFLLVLGGRGW